MKNKKNKIKTLDKRKFETRTLYLEEIEKLSIEDQEKYFEKILDNIYKGEEVESLRKYALRCIKLTCDPKDNKVHLPYGVIVEKNKEKIILKLKKNKPVFLIILFITLLLLAILGSSYSAITYSLVKNLNKDIDGDDIADINLDLNNDRIAEVNIDSNKDDKPDVNVDYKGNRKPVFNIDTSGNGIADFNLMNQDIDNDGTCDLNCDINNDGWPDLNLDLDGDGIADMEIDTNKDLMADLNFDMDGDGVCDLHCDTNNDKVCDKYCLTNEDLNKTDSTPNGSSSVIGNSNINIKTDTLELEYADEGTVFITGIYPDDQPGYENNIPPKKFKVINKSSLYVTYNLRWVVDLNDYESDNFKYSISSTLNGANYDFRTAPKETSAIATEIVIPPYSTQEYTINFKLQGVDGEQNYDQGKTFAGHIEIYFN